MGIVGIGISTAKFDAALLIGTRIRQAAFPDTEAGFEQLLAWLARHRPDQPAPAHACMEATGNGAWTSRLSCTAAACKSAWSIQPASRPTATASLPATRPTGSMQP